MINIITLETVNSDNLSFYKPFETAFDNGLNQYQSRIYPNKDAEKLLWYYIKTENQYIGSIWLEKSENKEYAVLGVFIADEKYRNKGLGGEAIKLVLEKMSLLNVREVRLNVRESNIRAIKCYRKTGFSETERYITSAGIAAIKMTYKI